MKTISRSYFLLILSISILFSCVLKAQENKFTPETSKNDVSINLNENEDQWFLDKYTDDYLNNSNERALYTDCIRLKNQETRDKVKYIYVNHPYEDNPDHVRFSLFKLLKFNNLEHLSGWVYVDSFKGFSKFKRLKEIKMMGATNNANYSFLDLTDLIELELISLECDWEFYHPSNPEIDFSGIENLNNLRSLGIDGTLRLKNIDCLSKLTEIKVISIFLDNENIEFLKNMVKLEYLYLFSSYNTYTYDRSKKEYDLTIDIQVINNLVNLKGITLRGFAVNNIEVINKLDKLTEAAILDCYINPNNDYGIISNRIDLLTEEWEGKP